MKKWYLILITILFFIKCTPKRVHYLPTKVPITKTIVVMGIELSSPTPYSNYKLTTINNNIDNSTIFINSFNKQLDSLYKKEDLEAKSYEINKLETRRKTVEDIKKEWEKIGYYSTESREKRGLFPATDDSLLTDFHQFIGLTYDDFVGKITELYGPADQSSTSNLVIYKSGTKLILKAEADYNGRFKSITLFGEEGLDFLRKFGLKDPKSKLLGLNISLIESILGVKLSKQQYTDDYVYRFSIAVNLRGNITFTCPSNANFTCEAIKIDWF